MKRFIQVLATAIVVLSITSLSSCRFDISSFEKRDKVPTTQIRKVKPFERIEVNNSIYVHYEQGNEIGVKVSGDKDEIENVLTESDGETLKIELKNKSFVFGIKMNHQIDVYVTSPDILSVNMYGSGDFEAAKQIDTDNLYVTLNGSGDMTFNDIICDKFKGELLGSGDMNFKKIVSRNTDFNVTGSGDMKAKTFDVTKTTISLVGSGDIDIYFNKCGSVSSNLTGSGDITLRGDAVHVEQGKAGSGDYHTSDLHIAE